MGVFQMFLTIAVSFSLLMNSDCVFGGSYSSNNAMQFIRSLGILPGLAGRSSMSPTLTLGKRKRAGDSPIYYIKLPPLPYYYANEQLMPVHHTPDPFHKLPFDFNNNGKPESVYHFPSTTLTLPYKYNTHSLFSPNMQSFSAPSKFEVLPQTPSLHLDPPISTPTKFNVVPQSSSLLLDQAFAKPSDPLFGASYQDTPYKRPAEDDYTEDPFQEVDQYHDDLSTYNEPLYVSNDVVRGAIDNRLSLADMQNNGLSLADMQNNRLSLADKQNNRLNLADMQKNRLSLADVQNIHSFGSLEELPMPHSMPSYLYKTGKPKNKPLISIKKNFLYNGKPSGIYVWKPREREVRKKYKHRYFKEFNY